MPKRRRASLIRLLAERGPVRPAASDFETLVARMLRASQLPQPVRQFEVIHAGELIARPDFAYPEVKFGIEAHSFDFHHTRGQWERDLERHRQLEAICWYLMYITWDDCVMRRAETVARICGFSMSAAACSGWPRCRRSRRTCVFLRAGVGERTFSVKRSGAPRLALFGRQDHREC